MGLEGFKSKSACIRYERGGSDWLVWLGVGESRVGGQAVKS